MSDDADGGLVARTAQLLARGGFAACLAFVVLVGGACALVVLGGFLSEIKRPEYAAPAGGIVAFVASILGALQVHAAPLAAFANATETSPRLLPTLRDSLGFSWRLAGYTFTLFVPYMFGACAVSAARSLAFENTAPAGFVVVVAGISGFGAVLAAWVHGRFVLLGMAGAVLQRSVSGPYGPREHLQLTAIGGIPVGTVVAFACQSLVRHANLSASLASTLDIFVTIATILALAAAVIVSCAAVVAFAAPPRVRFTSDS